MAEAYFHSFSTFLRNLAASFVTLLKVLIRARYRSSLPPRRLSVCSVLGNGPSLNESLKNYLDFIRTTEITCVNNFAHADVFTELQPENYVMLDPSYFTFTAQTTNRPDIRQTLTAFQNVVTWPMTLYVPHIARGSYLVAQASRNPQIRVVYFNYTVLRGFRWFVTWLCANGFGMLQAQTVIIAALTLMVNRQFETIYLFGADTSWHEQIRLSDQNQLLMKQEHFYDHNKNLRHEPVHVTKSRQRTDSMASQFLSLHKTFRGYEVLRAYADDRHVTILNASAKSYIDAFDRIIVSD